jgi:hypothetical protein
MICSFEKSGARPEIKVAEETFWQRAKRGTAGYSSLFLSQTQ